MNLVLFDGECMLCNRSVQWLLRIDKKEVLTFATLEFAKKQNLVADLDTQPDSIIYLQNAQLLNRTDALIAIMKDIGGIYNTAVLLKIFPSFLRNYVYDLIAKYRFKIWGKTEQCLFLNSKLRHRFLGI